MSRNPEVFRALKEDFYAKKLFVTFGVCAVSSLMIIILSSSNHEGISLIHSSEFGRIRLLKSFFYIVYFVVALWGGKEIIDQIVSDKINRAWDFLRMTPQSANEICLGRIAGSVLFPVFVACCFIPPTFFVFASTESVTFVQLLLAYLSFMMGALFVWFTSVAIASRYNVKQKSGIYMLALVLCCLFVSSSMWTEFGSQYSSSANSYYTQERETRLYWAQVTLFLSTIWMYVVARWNLLFELNARPKIFMTYGLLCAVPLIALFARMGIGGKSDMGTFVFFPIAIISLMLSFIEDDGLERYKKWFKDGKFRINETPVWLISALALCTTTIIAILESDQISANVVFYFIAMTLIILRDMTIVQLTSVFVSKHAGILALAILAILHTFTTGIIPLMSNSALASALSETWSLSKFPLDPRFALLNISTLALEVLIAAFLFSASVKESKV
jgi:hypothetical protein